MAVLSLLPCAAVVFGLAAVIAAVDVRTGRGYALGILSSLHLVITVIVVATITIAAHQQPPPTSGHTYSVTVLLVFYFSPAVYAMACTLIGAAIVAGLARHWLWIVGFVVAVAVPFLVAALPYSIWDLNTEFVVRQVGFLGVLVAPEATILAYSITRLVHPVAPARARQPALLN